MKKALAIALAVIILLGAITACSGGQTPPPADNAGDAAPGTTPASGTEGTGTTGAPAADGQPKILTFAYWVDPLLQLDPSKTIYNGVHVLNNIYETLLYYVPETGEYKNVLATSYESSDDGLTWTFKLREGVLFHNGEEMTADDVKYSIDRVVRLGQGAAYNWEYLDEIVVVDTYTVQFKMKQACPVDLILTCCKGAHVYPKSVVEENGEEWLSENACGTGPYKLRNVTWGTEVILEKFDEYWGGWDDDQFDIAVTRYVSETSARRQMVENGEAMVTHGLTAEDIAALESNPNVYIKKEQSIKSLSINISMDKLPNVNVRRALTYAIPYDRIVEFASGPEAAKKSKAFVPAGLLGYTEDLDYYTYDLEKAKALLEQEGVSELSLVMIYQTGDETQRKAAELMQTEYAKIGVTLELRAMTWDQMVEMARSDIDSRQDLFMMYWFVDKASANDQMRSLEIDPDMVLNYGKYNSEAFDTKLKEAYVMSGIDKDKAQKMYEEAQQIVLDDVAAVSIIDMTDIWVYNKHIAGIEPNGAYAFICRFHQGHYVD